MHVPLVGSDILGALFWEKELAASVCRAQRRSGKTIIGDEGKGTSPLLPLSSPQFGRGLT